MGMKSHTGRRWEEQLRDSPTVKGHMRPRRELGLWCRGKRTGEGVSLRQREGCSRNPFPLQQLEAGGVNCPRAALHSKRHSRPCDLHLDRKEDVSIKTSVKDIVQQRRGLTSHSPETAATGQRGGPLAMAMALVPRRPLTRKPFAAPKQLSLKWMMFGNTGKYDHKGNGSLILAGNSHSIKPS